MSFRGAAKSSFLSRRKACQNEEKQPRAGAAARRENLIWNSIFGWEWRHFQINSKCHKYVRVMKDQRDALMRFRHGDEPEVSLIAKRTAAKIGSKLIYRSSFSRRVAGAQHDPRRSQSKRHERMGSETTPAIDSPNEFLKCLLWHSPSVSLPSRLWRRKKRSKSEKKVGCHVSSMAFTCKSSPRRKESGTEWKSSLPQQKPFSIK